MSGHDMSEPDHTADKKKVNLANDPSGAEQRGNDETATAILKKKKKPNSLMYVPSLFMPMRFDGANNAAA